MSFSLKGQGAEQAGSCSLLLLPCVEGSALGAGQALEGD